MLRHYWTDVARSRCVGDGRASSLMALGSPLAAASTSVPGCFRRNRSVQSRVISTRLRPLSALANNLAKGGVAIALIYLEAAVLVAPRAGIEPATFRLGGERSIH